MANKYKEANEQRLNREKASRRWNLVKDLKIMAWFLFTSSLIVVGLEYKDAGSYLTFSTVAIGLLMTAIGGVAGFDSYNKNGNKIKPQ